MEREGDQSSHDGRNGERRTELQFDRLAKLSPAELEQLRQREVDAFIERAPEHLRKRLRGLQFEIDARRKAHKSPLGACISISRMMHDSLERLNAALQGNPLPERRHNAQVIPFPNLKEARRDRPTL